MAINTKTVKGRRKLRFETYDELMSEADQLAAVQIETLGNWNLAEIFEHLARSLESSIDGGIAPFPSPMRFMLKLFFKKKFVYQEIPSGFTFPDDAKDLIGPPSDAEVQSALENLRTACQHCKTETNRVPHPGFGKITREEWDQFNLRHAEMHLSFAKPVA